MSKRLTPIPHLPLPVLLKNGEEPPRFFANLQNPGCMILRIFYPLIMSDAAGFIAPHQFEKTERVAHGVNFANLVGVNSRDWD
jgi:hypothetical protein